MKTSNTSAQLQTLAAAGLVASRRDGVRVHYRIAGAEVTALAGQVQDFAAARLAEAEQAARNYLGDVAALEPVAQDELFRRLGEGRVLLLDVRPEAEYAAGHIPGAVSVAHDQLAARLAELARGHRHRRLLPGPLLRVRARRGPLLRAHGFTARPLVGGLPGWRMAGLPVTAAASARPHRRGNP
jgi:rhodanese-related sulfurtransferase